MRRIAEFETRRTGPPWSIVLAPRGAVPAAREFPRRFRAFARFEAKREVRQSGNAGAGTAAHPAPDAPLRGPAQFPDAFTAASVDVAVIFPA